jgi:two-component sensor histidine kinase
MPLYFISVVEDIQARKMAEEALARYHASIEALNRKLQGAMAETHHRVKNNLQQVAAFVSFQLDADGLSEQEQSGLRRLNSLVLALAALHEILTGQAQGKETTERVSSVAFFERLISLLRDASGARTIRLDAQEYALTSKQATTLATILNELVANALKHSTGDVEVRFTVEGNKGALQVCDNGPGFPQGFDARRAANMGLELVETLARNDLGGQVRYFNRDEGGACVVVMLPLHSAENH